MTNPPNEEKKLEEMVVVTYHNGLPIKANGVWLVEPYEIDT